MVNLNHNTKSTCTNAFKIHELSIKSRQKTLLNIANLTIPQGKFTAIIGANGAGKSTLLHALLGVVNGCQIQGQIQCLGKPCQIQVAQAKVAWVGQHERFDLPITALEYAQLGTFGQKTKHANHQNSPAQAQTLLSQFELESLIHTRIDRLSGGEKQRLAMVRALMQNTDIILLDEPTNHLDIKHINQLFGYLRHLVDDKQKTIVVVLHSLTHAHRYGDDIIALHDGRVFAQGTNDTVLTQDNLTALYGTPIYRYDTPQGAVFVS